jgi:hypothetical protein
MTSLYLMIIVADIRGTELTISTYELPREDVIELRDLHKPVQVFGGAGCVFTEAPIVLLEVDQVPITREFRLVASLPDPKPVNIATTKDLTGIRRILDLLHGNTSLRKAVSTALKNLL